MLSLSGPTSSAFFLVLAPGDQAQLSDVAPTLIAATLGTNGIRVLRFAGLAADDDAMRDATLVQHIRAAASERAPGQQLWLGGLSRGARVSVDLADELGAQGVIAFAYPFHPRHNPDATPRLTRLTDLSVPMWLAQGTRDSHGNQPQVRGYTLPDRLHIHWLEDANHALRPRQRSGHTQAEQLATACDEAADFMQTHSR